MTSRSHLAPCLVLAGLTLSTSVAAAAEGGGVVGWIEDARGLPVPGAVISLFGKGLRGGGLVTVSDSAGRFSLSSLPAGSYTIRALGEGSMAAPPRRITVLPNQDAVFSLSLLETAAKDALTAKADERAEATRELRWLVRHKKRSVLEDREADADLQRLFDEPRGPADVIDAALSALPLVKGTVEVVSAPLQWRPEATSDDQDVNLGTVRLEGRLADLGHWSLAGLVTESQNTSWRTAAEFVIEPGAGHEVRAGAGYGSQLLRSPAALEAAALDDRGTGALFVEDRWKVGRTSLSGGARYSYIGFVEDRNHLDPHGSVEVQVDERTRVRARAGSRTLVPGGDLLTVSTLASAPAIAYAAMSDRVRPERIWRYELGGDKNIGPTTVGVYGFVEDVDDQLVNEFTDGARRSLRIYGGGSLSARGTGLSIGHRFGDAFSGSVTYTYGHCYRTSDIARAGLPALRKSEFHDLVTRIETFVDRTDTRVSAFYRINTNGSRGETRRSAVTNSRFDVQLAQGLPLLGSLTHADWQVLVAFRNLYYETAEGGILDELMVIDPPKRLLGGISVKF